MPSIKKLLQAAAGNAGESLYVEDVFSTYLYTGTGVAITIDNGIDLAGEGGLVWLKNRGTVSNHSLHDTERTPSYQLSSNSTAAEDTLYGDLTSFNSDGFSLGTTGGGNNITGDIASWTFRKAEKFFDVVTYTGTGSVQTIAHNLGVAPAIIITKKTSGTSNWAVNDPSQVNPWSGALLLNSTNDFFTTSTVWNDTAPTDSVFTVGTADATNVSGQTYVAYLFASDAGGFGDDGSENIIKCGSYTGNGTTAPVEVNCGFEPQFVLIKGTTSGMPNSNWSIVDTMRGFPANTTATLGGSVPVLYPNATSGDDVSAGYWGWLTSTGFAVYETNVSASSINYIYIAIRRPMKTPESGTEVFMPTATSGATGTQITTGFASDLQITKYRPGSDAPRWADRLRGFAATDADTEQTLYSNGTDAEVAGGDTQNTLWNTGFKIGGTLGGLSVIYYSLKRATGFFDEVCFTQADYTEAYTHNLTVVPEMMIVKRRNNTSNWSVYTSAVGNTKYLKLEDTGGEFTGGVWGNTSPTSTQFTFSGAGSPNTYVAYLFATLAGVSKVGSYTGTAADLNVDCGFSAGARFILIKRTDDTGDWYVWDSARGIVAGNDPYFLLNSAAGEVTGTDYIDPLSSGFTVTSSAPAALNASGGTYIFLAIA